MAVAVENTGTGETPIQVSLLDGSGAVDLLDVNTPAAVVAVHASPDAPAVDVLADIRTTPDDEGIVLAQGLGFAETCEIPAVPAPGEYVVSITAAGDPNTVALQFELDPQPADDVTAIVSGFLTSAPAIQLLPLLNDRRSVFTEAKLCNANLRATSMRGVDLRRANLDNSDLSESDLKGAKFYQAVARNARFVKAELGEAEMMSANLMYANLARARIHGVDFRGANLYAADMARVRTDDRVQLDHALLTKVRVNPHYDPASDPDAAPDGGKRG